MGDVASAAIEHVRDALRNAVDAIEDAARACAAMSGAGVAGASGAVGFRCTMSLLVPVKDKTAALFHALNALAKSKPPTPMNVTKNTNTKKWSGGSGGSRGGGLAGTMSWASSSSSSTAAAGHAASHLRVGGGVG